MPVNQDGTHDLLKFVVCARSSVALFYTVFNYSSESLHLLSVCEHGSKEFSSSTAFEVVIALN